MEILPAPLLEDLEASGSYGIWGNRWVESEIQRLLSALQLCDRTMQSLTCGCLKALRHQVTICYNVWIVWIWHHSTKVFLPRSHLEELRKWF